MNTYHNKNNMMNRNIKRPGMNYQPYTNNTRSRDYHNISNSSNVKYSALPNKRPYNNNNDGHYMTHSPPIMAPRNCNKPCINSTRDLGPSNLKSCKPSFKTCDFIAGSCFKFEECPNFEYLLHHLVIYVMMMITEIKNNDEKREQESLHYLYDIAQKFDNVLGPEFRKVLWPVIEEIKEVACARLQSKYSLPEREKKLGHAMETLRYLSDMLGFYAEGMTNDNENLRNNPKLLCCIRDGWAIVVNSMIEIIYSLEDEKNNSHYIEAVTSALHNAKGFGRFMDNLCLKPKTPCPAGVTRFNTTKKDLSSFPQTHSFHYKNELEKEDTHMSSYTPIHYNDSDTGDYSYTSLDKTKKDTSQHYTEQNKYKNETNDYNHNKSVLSPSLATTHEKPLTPKSDDLYHSQTNSKVNKKGLDNLNGHSIYKKKSIVKPMSKVQYPPVKMEESLSNNGFGGLMAKIGADIYDNHIDDINNGLSVNHHNDENGIEKEGNMSTMNTTHNSTLDKVNNLIPTSASNLMEFMEHPNSISSTGKEHGIQNMSNWDINYTYILYNEVDGKKITGEFGPSAPKMKDILQLNLEEPTNKTVSDITASSIPISVLKTTFTNNKPQLRIVASRPLSEIIELHVRLDLSMTNNNNNNRILSEKENIVDLVKISEFKEGKTFYASENISMSKNNKYLYAVGFEVNIYSEDNIKLDDINIDDIKFHAINIEIENTYIILRKVDSGFTQDFKKMYQKFMSNSIYVNSFFKKHANPPLPMLNPNTHKNNNVVHDDNYNGEDLLTSYPVKKFIDSRNAILDYTEFNVNLELNKTVPVEFKPVYIIDKNLMSTSDLQQLLKNFPMHRILLDNDGILTEFSSDYSEININSRNYNIIMNINRIKSASLSGLIFTTKSCPRGEISGVPIEFNNLSLLPGIYKSGEVYKGQSMGYIHGINDSYTTENNKLELDFGKNVLFLDLLFSFMMEDKNGLIRGEQNIAMKYKKMSLPVKSSFEIIGEDIAISCELNGNKAKQNSYSSIYIHSEPIYIPTSSNKNSVKAVYIFVMKLSKDRENTSNRTYTFNIDSIDIIANGFL